MTTMTRKVAFYFLFFGEQLNLMAS